MIGSGLESVHTYHKLKLISRSIGSFFGGKGDEKMQWYLDRLIHRGIRHTDG
jgi:hypothetical protein